MTPTRPIVRYHGGKWKLAPWIIEHMPPHRIYVEPFGGGGSVLLRKPRTYAEIYNDLDGEIVNVFRMARDRGAELVRALELTPFAREEYDATRETAEDPVERARITITRAFQGFGSAAACGQISGFRASSSRSGSTPAMDWRNYPAAFVALIDRMQGVVIEQREAHRVMAAHDGPETLHYVDPPYVHATRSDRIRRATPTKSYKFELTDDDHRDLAVFLHGLRGMVMVSGYRCELYDLLFPDWHRLDRATHADGARSRVESLWLNKAAESMIRQIRLIA